MINKAAFYIEVRKAFGSIVNSQVLGFEAIINEYESQRINDLRHLAYILATVWHETAKTMQPINEFGKGKGKPYGKKLKYSRQPYITPDKIYYGRGHTQNTWFETYEKLTIASGNRWNFLESPELLLTMNASIWATFHAMQTGLYTGRSLKKYFNTTTNDPIGARKIINGTDKAEMIASYHAKFYKSLTT